MKSIDHHGKIGSTPAAMDHEFDRIRATFYARLRCDRMRLTTLATSLSRVDGHPAGVFKALQGLAHRIRGAAAVFEASELRDAAYALEQAATTACDKRSDHSDGPVWLALEELVEQLALSCGGGLAATVDFKPIMHLSEVAQRTGGGPRNTRHRPAKRRQPSDG
jgi:HPt (histidine-containing phosphotransfer) domain-containing protein